MELVFCDTLSEDADLYRFIEETKMFFAVHGVRFTRISAERDIWQIQQDVKYQANSRVDPCSRVAKRDLFKKHMKDKYPLGDAILVLGIDDTESHRTKDFERNHSPYKVEVPLCGRNITRNDIIDVLNEINIEPPRLYEMGFVHNNCGGFCVKAGQKQAAQLLRLLPDNYAWHETRQEETFALMGKRHPTIRKNVNGVMNYLSLREFREFIESSGKPDMYDEGNCACF
jgi:hypothetical protein